MLNFPNSAIISVGWRLIAILAYFCALITGSVLSFITRRQPRRRNIRIATVALTTPILLVIGFLAYLWFAVPSFKEPPTLAELQRHFPSKRADLELILL